LSDFLLHGCGKGRCLLRHPLIYIGGGEQVKKAAFFRVPWGENGGGWIVVSREEVKGV
jgi:hypothetical protein